MADPCCRHPKTVAGLHMCWSGLLESLRSSLLVFSGGCPRPIDPRKMKAARPGASTHIPAAYRRCAMHYEVDSTRQCSGSCSGEVHRVIRVTLGSGGSGARMAGDDPSHGCCNLPPARDMEPRTVRRVQQAARLHRLRARAARRSCLGRRPRISTAEAGTISPVIRSPIW